MFPQLVHIGNFSLPTYGFLVSLGVVLAILLIQKLAKQQGMDPDKVWNLAIIFVFAGIVGAKLLMFITEWDRFKNPQELFSLSTLQAGGVFSGGVVLAVICGAWYMRVNHMPGLRTADVFAPGLALGHAFGRLGCFSAGCCFGKETTLPWGVVFKNPLAHDLSGTPLNVHIHPTQLYEMIVELLNFAFLMWLLKRKRFEGQVVGAYMFIYGVARFFLEFVRGDEGRGVLFGTWLTQTQGIAIAMVIAGTIIWLRRVPLRQQAELAPAR
ncbi:prolipoprotein diacylglyceryl transferase [Candidatus Koribacter versatilis Ellin345]|uniref:Phosphatidylglycerol--prolipoprotein diacylglyceryl transferase n=1 Tax=Koribacter versatilis (strain Ellin345) TaxID=204669 RepID=Q1IMN0_KORVE|nr:prolipoprotein diacylglyceryl transferase [Candidatus Koribacter versatilis]ABF41870.1 prolipoprotein diacylglyceryl transferase [Candidatus Koribacter versatilis Ellin345]